MTLRVLGLSVIIRKVKKKLGFLFLGLVIWGQMIWFLGWFFIVFCFMGSVTLVFQGYFAIVLGQSWVGIGYGCVCVYSLVGVDFGSVCYFLRLQLGLGVVREGSYGAMVFLFQSTGQTGLLFVILWFFLGWGFEGRELVERLVMDRKLVYVYFFAGAVDREVGLDVGLYLKGFLYSFVFTVCWIRCRLVVFLWLQVGRFRGQSFRFFVFFLCYYVGEFSGLSRYFVVGDFVFI